MNDVCDANTYILNIVLIYFYVTVAVDKKENLGTNMGKHCDVNGLVLFCYKNVTRDNLFFSLNIKNLLLCSASDGFSVLRCFRRE